MSVPSDTQTPQQPSPQTPQSSYGYTYTPPSWSYYPYYPYTYLAYPPPKYYYEVTKYAPPFAPPGKKQSRRRVQAACILLFILAAVNLVSGSILLFAAYDESMEHTTILRGTIVDAQTIQPLKDVRIKVVGMGLTVSSDNTGSFKIPLPTGSYRLVFEKPGYQTINGTVFVGRYLDNNIFVEMEIGSETQNRTFSSFQTVEEYMANLMVSSTLSVFVGVFSLGSAFQIRKVKYRSLGIVSGVLGIFSLFIHSGLSLIFMAPGVTSALLGISVLVMIYFSSDMFISQQVAATGAK